MGKKRVPEWLENLPQEFLTLRFWFVLITGNLIFRSGPCKWGVREFLPLPLTQSDVEAALTRVRLSRKQLIPVANQEGKIIVVTGHKGGAGTTTVAVNLAQALAESVTGQVALVDFGETIPRCSHLPGPGIKLFHCRPHTEYCYPG